MNIPKPNQIKHQILEHLEQASGPMKLAVLVENIGSHFGVTEEEREERTPSGVKRFANRVNSVAGDLKSAGLLRSPRHGFLEITIAGRNKLNGTETSEMKTQKSRSNIIPENSTEQPLTDDDKFFIKMTSHIVASYVSKTNVSQKQLPEFIKSTHASLLELKQSAPSTSTTSQEPAIAIKNSVTEEYIFCLEDGKKFKTLKRHLGSKHNMSSEEYREKWGLPSDYPMIAKAYAETRSGIARKAKLGKTS